MRAAPLVPLLFLVASCALTRRFDPPVLLEAATVGLAEALARYPPGSELVELAPLAPPSGATAAPRRGVFVPADPGAPVVLHLLDSSVSFASEVGSPHAVAAELADLGLASLIVDYTGVGHSGGERSALNLRGDAESAWREAVARAGGDPRDVLVRAVSIGTIAAALLLESGARPRAQVWILPVFPDTVAPRYARVTQGPLFGCVARAFLRPVADLRLDEVVRESGVPTTVVAAARDELSSAAERAALAEAALESGGSSASLDGGHIVVAARARWLLAEELAPFRAAGRPATDERLARLLAELAPEVAARFPEGGAERERLRALVALQRGSRAEDVAAAALGPGEPLERARVLWGVRRRPYEEELTFDERVGALSLADPAGELPLELLGRLDWPRDLSAMFGGARVGRDAEAIAEAACGGFARSFRYRHEFGPELALDVSTDPRSVLAEVLAEVRASGGDESDARRRAARLLLKAERVPDRLVGAGDGSWNVEAKEGGVWRALDLSVSARAP